MPETKMPEPRPGPQPGRWVLSHGEIRTIVFGLMLAMFLAALNQTIDATALPTIGRDFPDFNILTYHFHWSMIFWFNVPLGLVAATMAHRSLKGLPRHDRKHKLDLLGAGLMAASASPLLLALTWGGSRYPWLSAPIAALVLAAAVLSFLFIWRLMKASEPFLPLPVLANPVMRMGTVCTSFSQGVVIGLTIFLPLYYEVVHKFTASDSGLALIPIVVMSTPGSILAGRAMMVLNHYKRVPLIGLACSIAALL